jgi:hypothetical protein
MASGSEVKFGFPYPPLALLMAFPGKALGDIRFSELAALLIGCACLAFATPGRVACLAAMLLLFTPRSLFVLEQGWSEPLAICWLGVLIASVTRRRSGTVPLGLLIAVKQHLALALLFAPWLHDHRRSATRLVIYAVLVAAAITLPFVVWDPSGFWRSVVALQFNEPFRPDSLSLVAALGRTGWDPSARALTLMSLGALALAIVFAWGSAPRTPAGFSLALGFCLLALFLFSKKAFCNYYYLVIALLASSIAAAGAETGRYSRSWRRISR